MQRDPADRSRVPARLQGVLDRLPAWLPVRIVVLWLITVLAAAVLLIIDAIVRQHSSDTVSVWRLDRDSSVADLLVNLCLVAVAVLLVLRARALSDSVVLVVFAVITVLMAVDDLWNLHLRFGAVIAHQLGLTGALGVDGAGWGAISVWLWALAAAIVAVGSAYRRSATGPRRLARGLILGTALLSLSSVGSTPLAALVDAPTNPAATWLLAALGTLLGLVSCALLLTVCLTEVDDEEYLTFDRRSTVTGSA